MNSRSFAITLTSSELPLVYINHGLTLVNFYLSLLEAQKVLVDCLIFITSTMQTLSHNMGLLFRKTLIFTEKA